MKSLAEHQAVFEEEAAAETAGAREDRCEDWRLAVRRRGQPKRRTGPRAMASPEEVGRPQTDDPQCRSCMA
jgi:hypothetical protein